MKTLVSIIGPTASGKTALSIKVAQRYGAPIISADSVQIYRGLDIGSGKVTESERQSIPHYMIDVADPCDDFSAGMYGREVEALLEKLFSTHDVVLLVGGAGLYLKAVWEGFDDMPEIDPAIREALNAEWREKGLLHLVNELREVDPATFETVDRQNQMRVIRALEVYRGTGQPISSFRKMKTKTDKGYRDLKVGLEWERTVLYERINARVDGMVAEGLVEEAKGLWEMYGSACKGLGSVGYREMVDHFEGKHDMEEAVRLVKRNSRRYAKRQMTWFKRSADIQWFGPGQANAVVDWLDAELGKEGEARA